MQFGRSYYDLRLKSDNYYECIPRGRYPFTIHDAFGDGMKLYLGGVEGKVTVNYDGGDVCFETGVDFGHSASGTFGEGVCTKDEATLVVDIEFDDDSNETSWSLVDECSRKEKRADRARI